MTVSVAVTDGSPRTITSFLNLYVPYVPIVGQQEARSKCHLHLAGYRLAKGVLTFAGKTLTPCVG